jgi:2'-5' RNA ligase
MSNRYFIGITLPEDLIENIARIQRNLFVAHKVMPPLVPHITLLDPNTLNSVDAVQFLPKVKDITHAYLPVDISLTQTALFGRRVFHIAIESPELLELQQQLVDLLPEAVRIKYQSGRPFRPHATIVQAKPSQNLSPRLIECFKQQVDPLLPRNFTAESLTQFQWLRPRTYKLNLI